VLKCIPSDNTFALKCFWAGRFQGVLSISFGLDQGCSFIIFHSYNPPLCKFESFHIVDGFSFKV